MYTMPQGTTIQHLSCTNFLGSLSRLLIQVVKKKKEGHYYLLKLGGRVKDIKTNDFHSHLTGRLQLTSVSLS